jgi:hypothetical protein
MADYNSPLPKIAQQGVQLFNRGEYYAAHDAFEYAWRAERGQVRRLYQGLLQVGVACHHYQRGNIPGAVKVMARGLANLGCLPAVCQGIDLVDFRLQAEEFNTHVLDYGTEQTPSAAKYPIIHMKDEGANHEST